LRGSNGLALAQLVSKQIEGVELDLFECFYVTWLMRNTEA
jgi:hypothetical protein